MFEDNERNAHKRAELMVEHLAFLRANAMQISAAGPLKDAEAGTPAGGLWLVSAASPAQVAALVKADPFWPTGLRKSFRILEWIKVFAPLQESLERPGGCEGSGPFAEPA